MPWKCCFVLLCCSLCMLLLWYQLLQKKPQKIKTTQKIFFFPCFLLRMCEGKKKIKKQPTKSKHLCYNLHYLKLQWISVYLPPKGLSLTILFLKIPLLRSLGSSLTQHTHTKHRNLAHSCYKIEEVQSHTSTIKTTNTTGFRRIPSPLERKFSEISFTDRKIFTLCFKQ